MNYRAHGRTEVHQGVTCAIPGAKRLDQVDDNVAASGLPPISTAQMEAIKAIYNRRIKPHVHAKW